VKFDNRSRRRFTVALALLNLALLAGIWLAPTERLHTIATITLVMFVIASAYLVVFVATRPRGDDE